MVIFAQDAPQILVKFKHYNNALMAPVENGLGVRMAGEIPDARTAVFSVRGFMSTEQVLRHYRSMPNVEWAEPNYVVRAIGTPNDPMLGQQWDFNKMSMPSVFPRTLPNVTVAVVDTGVDSTHPDLNGQVIKGWNFLTNTAAYADDHGHGTHVAGTVAGLANNGVGISGFGLNAKLLAVKVLGSNGSGTVSGVAAGIRWSADNGAKVINMSLGGPSSSAALDEAIAYAIGKGALVVAAAGNENTTTKFYPAASPGVLSVGASDLNDARCSFSNYGSWVKVAAPGTGIMSTLPGNKYAAWAGTSMASPHVAGLAAMVYGVKGSAATPATVAAAIEGSCDPVGAWVAKGRVNAAKALGGDNGTGTTFGLQDVTLSGTSFARGQKVVARFVFTTKAADAKTFDIKVKFGSGVIGSFRGTVAKGSDGVSFEWLVPSAAQSGAYSLCGVMDGKTVEKPFEVKVPFALASVAVDKTRAKAGETVVFTGCFSTKSTASVSVQARVNGPAGEGRWQTFSLPAGIDKLKLNFKIGADAKLGRYTVQMKYADKLFGASFEAVK